MQLGALVTVSVKTGNDITVCTGVVDAMGNVKGKPDDYWIQLAGLTTYFYSDDESTTIKEH